jgi:hypothetical protein
MLSAAKRSVHQTIFTLRKIPTTLLKVTAVVKHAIENVPAPIEYNVSKQKMS